MSAPSSPGEHLAVHRRTILFRSLLSGAAGLVPVPYLDDILAGQVRAGLVRRLAELRRVDIDRNAVAELSQPTGGRMLNAAAMGAVLIGGGQKGGGGGGGAVPGGGGGREGGRDLPNRPPLRH